MNAPEDLVMKYSDRLDIRTRDDIVCSTFDKAASILNMNVVTIYDVSKKLTLKIEDNGNPNDNNVVQNSTGRVKDLFDNMRTDKSPPFSLVDCCAEFDVTIVDLCSILSLLYNKNGFQKLNRPLNQD